MQFEIDDPITIISDLHVGHPACYIRDPSELAPLFRDTATVVFNGDSVEMLWLYNREKAQGQMVRIAETCQAEGGRPLFLNGNHDPVISSASHLDLCDGAVLVMHGDLLFHDVAPWSPESKIIGPEHSRILDQLDEEAQSDFEHLLIAVKKATLALEMHEPTAAEGLWAKIGLVIREGWPPWQALKIIKFWMQTPARAVKIARTYRPGAQFIVIGHTHYAGVWQNGSRIVVNTGSFLPFSGRLAVRLESDRLEVRKVVFVKGQWRFGNVVATHEVSGLPEEPRPK